jgi:hypothetical protein
VSIIIKAPSPYYLSSFYLFVFASVGGGDGGGHVNKNAKRNNGKGAGSFSPHFSSRLFVLDWLY